MYLVYQKGMGGEPEEVLLHDRPMKVAIVLWLITILLLLALDHGTTSLLKLSS
jgi:hypothetical protein